MLNQTLGSSGLWWRKRQTVTTIGCNQKQTLNEIKRGLERIDEFVPPYAAKFRST